MPETNLVVTQEPGSIIRKFSDAKVNEAVNSVLATIPPDKMGAVVAVADLKGAKLAVAARLGSNWSVVGVLEKQWKGELKGEAAVRFAWVLAAAAWSGTLLG